MNADQIAQLLDRLDQLLFVLQTCAIALCYLCGFATMQFIIHAKNQKNLF